MKSDRASFPVTSLIIGSGKKDVVYNLPTLFSDDAYNYYIQNVGIKRKMNVIIASYESVP